MFQIVDFNVKKKKTKTKRNKD